MKLKCVTIISLIVLFSNTLWADSADTKCLNSNLLIIDAGSTGSRGFYYCNNKQPKLIKTNAINPGIHSLPLRPKIVNQYLDNLFSPLFKVITKPVAIHLYATAGMRFKSPHEQSLLFKLVKAWAKKQPKVKSIYTQVITGQQEGFLSWLALNYNTQNQKYRPLIEFGGGSVQIAMPVTNTAKGPNIFKVQLGNKIQPVFVKSYLGLGSQASLNQLRNASGCFFTGFTLPNGQRAQFNFESCRKKILNLVQGLHQVHIEHPKNSLMNTDSQWYILGGIKFLMKYPVLKTLTPTTEFTVASFKDYGANTCQHSWQKISKLPHNPRYFYQRCFNYVNDYTLLKDGFGLADNTKLLTKFKGYKQGWALGALLCLNGKVQHPKLCPGK